MDLISYKDDFQSFDGHIWLNTASEGPLPLVSARALTEAVEWKSKPYLLDYDKFARIPKELKISIGKIIGASPRDIILGNSASYGVHILANGYPWQKGDEIILMQNDFPTNILPWLALQEKGVVVRQVPAANFIVTPEEVKSYISEKTKFICLSQIHTFSGAILDVDGFSRLCREHNIYFILNLSQSVGNQPINLEDLQIDAVISAGYKWLCGPYGTGFSWMKPELRDQLELNYNYWITSLTDEDLKNEGVLEYRSIRSARKYDVFCTANFFNFVPFRVSIDFLLNIGIEKVFIYNQQIIKHLIERLLKTKYYVVISEEVKQRSNLVVLSHADENENERIFCELKKRRIHLALWKNKLRVSPHIHNSIEDIDQLVDALMELY